MTGHSRALLVLAVMLDVNNMCCQDIFLVLPVMKKSPQICLVCHIFLHIKTHTRLGFHTGTGIPDFPIIKRYQDK